MLSRRLIPSLLLSNGRLVKGVRYAAHKDAGRPDTTARAHNAQGADEMILMDIDASRRGRRPDFDAVRAVAAECSMPLTVGGGIRSVEDARDCMAAGADKLCLNTTAIDDPDLITRLARLFGAQAVVLGLDVTRANGRLTLFNHRVGQALTGRDPVAWAKEAVARGAGEIRLMSVDREGTRQGMDLDLMETFMAAVNVPVILEGGAGSLDHLSQALGRGADAVAVGTMLVFSDNNLVKIKRYLAADGHDMRIG